MKVNNRVLILREAITKIVPMLTQRSVTVTQRGTRAYVAYNRMTLEIEKVNLPYIPDDASDILLDATQGFLDHEVGHILFTDQKMVVKAEKAHVHTLHNIIEDTFVERRMGEQFPGCGANLTKMHGFFLTEYIDGQLKEKPEHASSILLVVIFRAWAGQTAFVDYMKGKWPMVQTTVDRLGKDFPEKVRDVNSSEQGLALAIEAKKLLEPKPVPVAPPAPPPVVAPPPAPAPVPPATPEPEEEEEPPSVGAEPTPAAGGAPTPGDTEEEGYEAEEPPMPNDLPNLGDMPLPEDGEPLQEHRDGDGDTPASSGVEPEDEGEEDGGMPGGASPEPEEADDGGSGGAGEAEGDAGESAGTSGGGGAPGDGEPAEGDGDVPTTGGGDPPAVDPNDSRDLFKELEEAGVKEFDDAAAEALSKDVVASTKNSEYTIFTRDEDSMNVLEASEGFDQTRVTIMQSEVDHMIGPLQKDLQRAISARSASVWTGGHKRGRLHGASLARVLTGRDDVFKQKQVNKTKDVAVSLVVDASGSMWSDNKMEVAAYTAYALSSVLDNLGIPNEVLAFTTQNFSHDIQISMQDEERKHGFRYDRTAALNIAIVKSFAERINPDIRRRFALLAGEDNGLMEENVDGESVQLAHRRLMQQRSARKVMMVLSDGKPACGGMRPVLDKHLINIVKQIEARGTDVVALGIIDDSVKKFYKNAIVMKKVSDLPTLVMHELFRLLVR
jgi:cobaltochelatase CobT